MITAIYSILHFLVDGVCAFAMAMSFANAGYEKFLIYNFCAFALQMPMGAVLDGVVLKSRKNYSVVTAILGVALTLVGAFVNPAVLGIGNALFHVGAGISVIREDYGRGWKGQALGIFVAPGAFGLFVGAQLANKNFGMWPVFMAAIVMGILSFGAWKREPVLCESVESSKKKSAGLVICCVLVVILRSYAGLAVSFSWKTTIVASLIGVFAVVLGKMAGGILSVRAGLTKTVVASLLLSTICYLFSANMICGVLALFLFNMTMPITLYLLVDHWRELPGFAFGLLTFGLFLGFVPVYMGLQIPVSSNLIGAVSSLLSLVILLIGIKCDYSKGV